MPDRLASFCKACPRWVRLTDAPDEATRYKYFLIGKGCVLGVLFEDSVAVYFEWIGEDGCAVVYPPRLRYLSWTKQELARLIGAGVWEAESVRPVLAEPTCAAVGEAEAPAEPAFWLN